MRRKGSERARNYKARAPRAASCRCYIRIQCCIELHHVEVELGLSRRWVDEGQRRKRFSTGIEGLGGEGIKLRGSSWEDTIGHKEGHLKTKNELFDEAHLEQKGGMRKPRKARGRTKHLVRTSFIYSFSLLPYFPQPGFIGLPQILQMTVTRDQSAKRDQTAFERLGEREGRVKVGEGTVD